MKTIQFTVGGCQLTANSPRNTKCNSTLMTRIIKISADSVLLITLILIFSCMKLNAQQIAVTDSVVHTTYGDSTGSITLHVLNGQPVNFHWSTGNTASQITHLKEGTYLVTVSNSVDLAVYSYTIYNYVSWSSFVNVYQTSDRQLVCTNDFDGEDAVENHAIGTEIFQADSTETIVFDFAAHTFAGVLAIASDTLLDENTVAFPLLVFTESVPEMDVSPCILASPNGGGDFDFLGNVDTTRPLRITLFKHGDSIIITNNGIQIYADTFMRGVNVRVVAAPFFNGSRMKDAAWKKNPSTEGTCISPHDPGAIRASADTVCAGSQVTLIDTVYPNSTTEWYANAPGSSGVLVGSGDTVTVTVDSSTIFYVQNKNYCPNADNMRYSKAVSKWITAKTSPQPPVAPVSQSVCVDTTHMFTFDSIQVGSGGDSIEWSLNNNFSGSHFIYNYGHINATISAGNTDTIWMRTGLNANGCVSKKVWTTASVDTISPPIYASSWMVFNVDSYTFQLSDITASKCANQIVWSRHSNFDTSYVLNSPAEITMKLYANQTDSIWFKSKDSATGKVSSARYIIIGIEESSEGVPDPNGDPCDDGNGAPVGDVNTAIQVFGGNTKVNYVYPIACDQDALTAKYDVDGTRGVYSGLIYTWSLFNHSTIVSSKTFSQIPNNASSSIIDWRFSFPPVLQIGPGTYTVQLDIADNSGVINTYYFKFNVYPSSLPTITVTTINCYEVLAQVVSQIYITNFETNCDEYSPMSPEGFQWVNIDSWGDDEVGDHHFDITQQQGQTHTYTTPGMKTIEYTIHNQACLGQFGDIQNSVNVQVGAPNVSLSMNPRPACGGSTTIQAAVDWSEPVVYQWASSNGSISEASSSITVTLPDVSTTYYVTVTDPSMGCSATASITWGLSCTGDIIDGTSDTYTFSSQYDFRYLSDVLSYNGSALQSPASVMHVVLNGDFELYPPGTPFTANLKNLDITMGANSSITIHPGQKLIVDNSVLHDCCSMWNGIIVQGTKTQPQDLSTNDNATAVSSHQGFLYLTNATIENAYEAIQVWNPVDGIVTPTNINNTGGTGGIVRAINSTFINNGCSADFRWYKSYVGVLGGGIVEQPNKSWFINCAFTTNDAHRSNRPFSVHVMASGVKDIQFLGCTFENAHTITGSTNANTLGTGIETADAGIIVDDYLISNGLGVTNFTRSQFNNLQHGIFVSNTSSVYTARVKHAIFENCIRGIRNEGVDLTTFAGNQFTMGDNPAYEPEEFFDEGIILHQATGFKAEQNSFVSDGSKHITVGIRADETGASDNRVYNDTFTINVGNLANRQNQFNDGHNPPTGLQYNCNQNPHNDLYDICVAPDDATQGVRARQGELTLSAGNTFSHDNSNIAESDFFNSGVGLDYYLTGAANGGNSFYPLYRSSSVTTHNFGLTVPNGCVSNYSFPSANNPAGGGCIGCLTLGGYTDLYNSHKAQQSIYNTKYLALIDGGNTQKLLRMTDTSTVAGRLRDSLLSYSPNLSSTVLNEVAQNSLLNQDAKYLIMKANAEGVTAEILDYLDENDGFNSGMLDSIEAAGNNLTLRSYLLDTLVYHMQEREQANYSILQLLQDDTSGFNMTTYRAWLDSSDGLWAKEEKVNSYLQESKFDTALTLLAHYGSTALHNATDSADFENYGEYVTAYANWIAKDSSIMRLDSLFIIDLRSLAKEDEHKKGSNAARNILNFFYDSLYFTPAVLPDEEYGKKGKDDVNAPTANQATQPKEAVSMKLYPNPAQNSITIEYSGVEENSKLYVTDILGVLHEVKSLGDTQGKFILNTANYANGVYFARIEPKGGSLLKKKFIILK